MQEEMKGPKLTTDSFLIKSRGGSCCELADQGVTRMTQRDEFFNIDDTTSGIARELGPGLNTRIYAGEQAMLSVVTIAPNAKGELHKHPEEQWGLLLEGSGVRIQGDDAHHRQRNVCGRQ